MKELRYTLISDGSSDRALLPLLSWLLDANGVHCPIQPEWADLGRLHNPPKDLAGRIALSLRLYPCDLLFVHRDAEKFDYARRKAEIEAALAATSDAGHPSVCVVPVRMQEAWLLFDEAALRRASGNPHGQSPLELPSLATIEKIPNPKEMLHGLLAEASELKGRRRQNLNVRQCAIQLAGFIEDFAPLRGLPAFRALESDIQEALVQNRWTEAV